jgi:hypothetical protein
MRFVGRFSFQKQYGLLLEVAEYESPGPNTYAIFDAAARAAKLSPI